MTYELNIHESSGLIVERMQPITRYDVDLVRAVLEDNDRAVIGIGAAQISHDKGFLMTAGERIDVVDYTLKAEGIDPARYIIVPVQNWTDDNARWMSEVHRVTPAWYEYYTRNFKNASVFSSFANHYGFKVTTLSEQKPETDYYADIARNDAQDLPDILDSTRKRMWQLGINTRAKIIYNREDLHEEKSSPDRALFLGGFQPITGIYNEGNGHIGMFKKVAESGMPIVMAIGSGQVSDTMSDPLTAGERIDVLRYSLLKNGVRPGSFYTVPVNDMPENAGFPPKVVAMSPTFNTLLVGDNDRTGSAFGDNYKVITTGRTPNILGEPISGSRVRKDVVSVLKANVSKSDSIDSETMRKVRRKLEYLVDSHTLDKLEDVGFFRKLHFLAHAVE